MKEKLNKTVTLYTLLMLIVFPLFMVHSYYDIQTVKMYFYQLSTLACAGISALIAAVYLMKGCGGKKPKQSDRKPIAERLRGVLRTSDVFALIFLLAVIISTVCSEWVYEAFWGNTGRYQGGYMLILFVVSYFLITRYYVPKRIHMDIVLGAGIIVCGWGVLDYFSLSPVGFAYDTLFSSTIGNIDVLTSIEAMYVAMAAVMYIAECPSDKVSKRRSAYYLFASCVCFMGLECGRTANLLLSVAFLICFLPFYAFGSVRGTLNYIRVLIVWLIGMLIVAELVSAFPDYAVSPDYMGELDAIANNHVSLLLYAVCAMLLLYCILYGIFRKCYGTEAISCAGGVSDAEHRLAKKLRTVWGILGVIALCVCVYIFRDANTGGHPELYAPVSNLVIFDEKWGTNRGYVWRLAMKYFGDFSLFKKIVGSGPETFSIYVMKYDLNATLRQFDASYDSIHNEWIQHLFECGIVGFIGFYGMSLASCVTGLKNGRMTAALSFAVLTYIIQSFVNISVPIVLPFVIICIAAAASENKVDYGQ